MELCEIVITLDEEYIVLTIANHLFQVNPVVVLYPGVWTYRLQLIICMIILAVLSSINLVTIATGQNWFFCFEGRSH